MKIKELVVATLVFSLSLGSLPANAQETGVVVDRAAIEQALTQRVLSDEGARDSIRTLLSREDVKAMAGELGLDVRRASNAVSTLEGAELQRVASRAVAANDLLTGGSTVQISLVTLLLIIIIIILVAK